jgi:hypothetical protein
VRVRSLVIAFAMIAAAVTVVWSLRWATGLQPVSGGSWFTAPIGLTPFRHSDGVYDTGPTVYAWARDGRYVVGVEIHNSASVPITITGADRTFPEWEGAFTGPTLGITNEHRPSQYSPFHPVRIPADGWRSVSFIFTANPRACRNPAGRLPGFSEQDSVTVHFTALGVFHGTQTVPLGEAAAAMAAPTRAACA